MSDAVKVDDSEKTVKIYEDVPRTGMVVRGKEDARSALLSMRGDERRDRCHFCCIMCGWDGTIALNDDELAAIDGDVESYSGPCPGFAKDDKGQPTYEKDAQGEFVLDALGAKTPVPCLQSTLLPKSRMGAGEFTPGEQVAKRQKMRELREQAEVNADVFIEKAVQAAAGVMTMPSTSMEPPATAVVVAPPKPE